MKYKKVDMDITVYIYYVECEIVNNIVEKITRFIKTVKGTELG